MGTGALAGEADSVLAQAKAVAGGEAWAGIGALRYQGEVATGGMTCTLTGLERLGDGVFRSCVIVCAADNRVSVWSWITGVAVSRPGSRWSWWNWSGSHVERRRNVQAMLNASRTPARYCSAMRS